MHSNPHHLFLKFNKSVDIKKKKSIKLQVGGRHDPCVVPRAPPVVDSLVALTIADHALLSGFYKTNIMKMTELEELRKKIEESYN